MLSDALWDAFWETFEVFFGCSEVLFKIMRSALRADAHTPTLEAFGFSAVRLDDVLDFSNA